MSASQKMVLLKSIVSNDEEFRDHAYIEVTDALDKLLNTHKLTKGNNRPVIVEFDAKVKQYPDFKNGGFKETLTSIKNIRILGRA